MPGVISDFFIKHLKDFSFFNGKFIKFRLELFTFVEQNVIKYSVYVGPIFIPG